MDVASARRCSVLHLNAGNDENGAPRRLYVLVSAGVILDVVNKGSSGEDALNVWGAKVGEVLKQRIAPIIVIPVSEYRRLRKRYGA